MSAYIVMGVSGCGKSEIGKRFAKAIGGRFFDGDDLHPKANIAKMSRGEALNDQDRAPWLDQVGAQLKQGEGATIVACSALKRSYRERIAAAAQKPVTFLFLDGSRDVLLERMSRREGHFMPVTLLDSQLATLEPPQEGEHFVRASIDQSPDKVVDSLLAGLQG